MSHDCKELHDKLSSYLDGELIGDDLQEVMAHIEECDCCRHCLDTLKITRDALLKMTPPEMPADMKERLKACLKKEDHG